MYDLFGFPAFLAAYNAGPERVNGFLNRSSMLPAETVNYLTMLAPRLEGTTTAEGPLSVFLRNPAVVVLDEASSRLDPATEMQLERAVDRLLTGRTVILIAHRLATVARADLILILEGGQVVEAGPQAALARDPGSRLSELLRAGLETEVLA